jgi:short-subunit dehydrogenase
MKAVVTGASSGIGKEIAKRLSRMGYELYLVARREDRLKELASDLSGPSNIIVSDLSKAENCFSLYESLKNEDIDIFVNNAGFGAFGESWTVPLERELSMIDLNVSAVHILTKLFLKDFKEKNKGYILNIASVAAFFQGPLLSTYYATKAYVLKYSFALNSELRKNKSNTYVGAVCPGPVKTEFSAVSGVEFFNVGLEASYVAKIAIKKMFKKKPVIVPGLLMKVGIFLFKFLPLKLQGRIAYFLQRAKKK